MALQPELKQRLVGAVVLVALAVIVIPMVLDNHGAGPADNELPAKPGFNFEPLAIPPETPKPLEPRPAVVERAKTAPVTVGPVAADTPKPTPTEPKQPLVQPATPEKRDASVQAWAVQAGSFSSEDNALSLRDKLRAARFPAFVEKVAGDKGPVFRVRVGPEASREQAETLQQKVNASMRLKALVMAHP